MFNIIAELLWELQISQEGNHTTNYFWLYPEAVFSEATFKSKLEFNTLSVSIRTVNRLTL